MAGWPDADDRELRVLWGRGLSTAEIGRRMMRSKNSIVGRAHRLDLESRPSPIREKNEAKAIPLLRRPSLPDMVSTSPPREAPPEQNEEREAQCLRMFDRGFNKATIHRATGIPMDVVKRILGGAQKGDLEVRSVVSPMAVVPLVRVSSPMPVSRSANCLWPTGIRTSSLNTFGSCGDRAVPGKSYCHEHAKLAYVRVRDRKEDVA